jgi:transposase
MPIIKAAKELGMKYSTAKLIYKRYREEGTFFENIKDRNERMRLENL